MSIKKKKFLFAIPLTIAFSSSLAHANAIDYSSFEALFQEPVTAGATGSPQRVSDAPINMQIITSEEIQRSAAKDIPEILRRVAGVSVWRSGMASHDVSIRGLNQGMSERLLVLVNGRQVYLDHYGYVDWNSIPVELNEIKQIEVVKGPNTALYGFNATSGVINIITFNPMYDDVNVVEAIAGNHQFYGGSGVATVKPLDNIAIRVSSSGYNSEEFNGPYVTSTEQSIARDPENSKFKLDGVIQAGDSTQLDFEFTKSRSEQNEYAIFNVIMDAKYNLSSMKVGFNTESDYGLWEGKLYKNKSIVDYKFPFGSLAVVAVPVENEVTVAQLSNIFKYGTENTFRLNAEYRENENNVFPFDSSGNSDISYDVFSFSGLWSWNITDNLTLSSAARYDKLNLHRDGVYITTDDNANLNFNSASFDKTIEETSFNVGLVAKITDEDTFRAMYAKGVDLPSIA